MLSIAPLATVTISSLQIGVGKLVAQETSTCCPNLSSSSFNGTQQSSRIELTFPTFIQENSHPEPLMPGARYVQPFVIMEMFIALRGKNVRISEAIKN